MLAQIAIDDTEPIFCRLAESKVIEPGLTSMIAAQANDRRTKENATAKLSCLIRHCQDQETLARVLLHVQDQSLRQSALAKISSEDWLVQIVANAPDPPQQQDVLAKIRRPDIWQRLSQHERPEVRNLSQPQRQPLSPSPAPTPALISQEESIPPIAVIMQQEAGDDQVEAVWQALQQVAASDKSLLLHYLSPAAIQLLLQKYRQQ